MRSIESTVRIALATTAIAGGLAGCATKADDGNVLNVANETSCWSMPGGEHVSRLDRTLAQKNQSDLGNIAEGVQVTVTKDGAATPYDSGYIQAEVPNVHGENPITGEEINLGSRTCWIKSADLKK